MAFLSPSPMELAVIAVIALLVLGPSRLPDAARSLGKGMREMRDSFQGFGGGDDDDDDEPRRRDPRAERDEPGGPADPESDDADFPEHADDAEEPEPQPVSERS